jgi:hypothetical protein
MPKYTRPQNINTLQDPSSIDCVRYNLLAGADKIVNVGPKLIPIQIAGGYTTNVSGTPVALPVLGKNLAIYNNSGTVGTVTIGNVSTITSQAIGASDTMGNVGIPCKPNDWTYLSMGINQYIISSAATIFVYIIEDSSHIAQEL